ncbi:hypothetical protein QTN47_17215 [Danxiaibacter flavus]|uniref:Uncharacterized protein n=1 Tax=Danxiaibacter flavus TaxID=3049108 RepID=A0ABV3ZL23_9BACT|nr:hypothetical protein QNM32_17225 [Chitinophagaceae bacterium DXS]
MNLLEKCLDNFLKFQWFVYTLVGGMIPVGVRFLVAYNFNLENKLDIKDLLFASLAMNISNFSLLTNDDHKLKSIFSAASGMLLVFISVAIGIYMAKENEKLHHPAANWIFTGLMFIVSIGLSYTANFTAIKTKEDAN